MEFSEKVSFIWSVADLLRGDYKQSEYGKVILPLVVLRRLDCVLAPTKEAVLAEHGKHQGRVENVDPILERITGHKGLFNTSKFDLPKLLDDPNHVADNLRAYIAGFSAVPREVMHRFGFDVHIDRLDRSKLLYLVVSKFCDACDRHPPDRATAPTPQHPARPRGARQPADSRGSGGRCRPRTRTLTG